MGMSMVSIDLTNVIKNHFSQCYNQQNLLEMSCYWHELIDLLANSIIRGGFLSDECLYDVYGERLLDGEEWDGFIDGVYDDVVLVLDELPISELFNHDVQGKVELVETIALVVDDDSFPCYLGFKIRFQEEYLHDTCGD